jgi:hypothetical protein
MLLLFSLLFDYLGWEMRELFHKASILTWQSRISRLALYLQTETHERHGEVNHQLQIHWAA